MKKCIIVGAGDYFGLPVMPEPGDLLIAADAGYKNLKKEDPVPDLIIGDFDSMHVPGVRGVTGDLKDLSIFEDAEKASYLQHLGKTSINGVETRIIDPVKNDPDLLAAVRIGLEKGCREFHLAGAVGGRMDHTEANVQILHFLSRQGAAGYLYGRDQVLTALTNGTVRFPNPERGYFSALSLSDVSRGVTEAGFKYIVKDVTLNNFTPTGLSNEFVERPSTISVREGTLLLIYPAGTKLIRETGA